MRSKCCHQIENLTFNSNQNQESDCTRSRKTVDSVEHTRFKEPIYRLMHSNHDSWFFYPFSPS